MIQDKCLKLKANGTACKGDRIYVQTLNYIYMFKNERRIRCQHIQELGAIIESTQAETDFILFF